MKTGMNLLLWTGHVTPADYPTLAKLKAAGFDGVEIPVFGGTPADYKAKTPTVANGPQQRVRTPGAKCPGTVTLTSCLFIISA